MESLCRTKKNMFRPIREGIEEALQKLSKLHIGMEDSDCYLDHFECYLRDRVVTCMREVKTAQKSLSLTPEVTTAMKPEEMRPRTSRKKEE